VGAVCCMVITSCLLQLPSTDAGLHVYVWNSKSAAAVVYSINSWGKTICGGKISKHPLYGTC
jgi:hypothetical protein